jgi:hypothetical protein
VLTRAVRFPSVLRAETREPGRIAAVSFERYRRALKRFFRMDPIVRFQPSRWCLMATVQVAEGAPNLADILVDLDFDFRLDPAPASPPGHAWFHLLVDARRGQRRCELTAHRLLSALQRIAEAGDLPGFRVIAGERWLEYPAASDAMRPETHTDALGPRRH